MGMMEDALAKAKKKPGEVLDEESKRLANEDAASSYAHVDYYKTKAFRDKVMDTAKKSGKK